MLHLKFVPRNVDHFCKYNAEKTIKYGLLAHVPLKEICSFCSCNDMMINRVHMGPGKSWKVLEKGYRSWKVLENNLLLLLNSTKNMKCMEDSKEN